MKNIVSTEQKQSSKCVQQISTKVYVAADLKGKDLQVLEVKSQKKYLLQMGKSKWRPKTRATNKIRLNMKRILNPKMKNEKVTIIEDSSSEENMENEEDSSSHEHYIQEDHLVSLELVQGGHYRALEGKTIVITE